MKNRIDIFKGGKWLSLRLGFKSSIKYNKIGNRIGKLTKRGISHTNTFSIPNITENQQVLGLNVFNVRDYARALNSKYIARYIIGDKLIQEGFIVINNSKDNDIKLNFIDGALNLIDKWKTVTHKQLIKSDIVDGLVRTTDYETAITEMEDYAFNRNADPQVLTDVPNKTHGLALFPNNLNQIGENFQLVGGEDRVDDSYIVTQCRPIWNVKAFFDMATESFGYTPEYDPSINWTALENDYFTSEVASKGRDVEEALISHVAPRYDRISDYAKRSYTTHYIPSITQFTIQKQASVCILFDPEQSIRGDILHMKNVVGMDDFYPHTPFAADYNAYLEQGGGHSGITDYSAIWDNYSIFKPNIGNTTEGDISVYYTNVVQGGVSTLGFAYAIYESNVAGVDYECMSMSVANGTGVSGDFMTIDKSELSAPPVTAGDFVGIMMFRRSYQTVSDHVTVFSNDHADLSLTATYLLDNVYVAETFLPIGEVFFGEFSEYLTTAGSGSVDLTHAASEKPIQEIILGLMQKEGVLMNIDDQAKTIKFFSYGHYEKQKEDNNYSDWSEYFRHGSEIIRNTDYGKAYGKKNRISLSDPFHGNYFDRTLLNYHEDSKYPAFKKSEVAAFKDVTGAVSITSATEEVAGDSSYLEFSTSEDGLSLVTYVGDVVGNLTHIDVAGIGSTSGDTTFTGLHKVANLNYLILPNGVQEWYSVVDNALRVTGKFLLPVHVVRTLDISEPIYINELGGFYIIEEIAEYVDSKTVVNVKLIKLIDNLSLS